MSQAARTLPALILVALALLGGCASASSVAAARSGDTDGAERSVDRVVATVLFADTVALVGLRPAREFELPSRPVNGVFLEWTLESRSGEAIASGEIADPRMVVGEFRADGTPDPKRGVAGAASLQIEIPNVGGTLVLQEPSGAAGGVSPDRRNGARERWTLDIEKYDKAVPWKSGGESPGEKHGQ